MNLITVNDVSFAYEGSTVVKELNFSIEEGDYLCIVGENGSGKTTLMNGLLGLKKTEKGQINYNSNLKTTEIGYLPQQKVAQKDFPASVWEIVLSGRLNKQGITPFYTTKDKQTANHNIDLLKISKYKNKCYRELSGGLQQRVLLARALCATEKLILLDEPATGLDPVVSKELYSIIKNVNEEMGITVIMVSHDINASVEYANKILHLAGKQEFFGSAKDYVNTSIGKKFVGGEENA